MRPSPHLTYPPNACGIGPGSAPLTAVKVAAGGCSVLHPGEDLAIGAGALAGEGATRALYAHPRPAGVGARRRARALCTRAPGPRHHSQPVNTGAPAAPVVMLGTDCTRTCVLGPGGKALVSTRGKGRPPQLVLQSISVTSLTSGASPRTASIHTAARNMWRSLPCEEARRMLVAKNSTSNAQLSRACRDLGTASWSMCGLITPMAEDEAERGLVGVEGWPETRPCH